MKLNYEDLGVFLPEMKEEEKQDLVKRLGKLSDVEYKQVQEIARRGGRLQLNCNCPAGGADSGDVLGDCTCSAGGAKSIIKQAPKPGPTTTTA